MAAPVRVPPPAAAAALPPREAEAPEVPRGSTEAAVVALPLGEVHPNPLQPRRRFTEEALKGLAESLRVDGFVQPITVRPRPAGGYEIVAGERRWRAAGIAELETVDAVVRPLNDGDAARWALIENVQREDLNPMERARALHDLCETQSLSHAEVAAAVGLSRPAVSNLIRLLGLTPAVQKLVIEDHLKMGHARVLTGIEEPSLQEALAERCVSEGWSVRRLEQEAQRGGPPARRRSDEHAPPAVKAAWLRDLESQLTAGLETPVRVAPGRKRGTGVVTLEYRSLEDFDRLLARLGIQTG
ncbi:putative chromosome partitioning protein ParB [Phycisphaera mikurensis NBRC 102666]|uniref:Putative chromosome partitioning protein ParB n=1 Tax=Phycisphaera mikurensis (strain NBRC 102666 / KCTC 22515 / FYK2301M01) TaxID=1142394 RepID=I0IAV0_PHYMF|nr:putative chromosome partitioning protein ParB [Phycisphaera mikurensis NBRC 102666]